jgi:chemotaxis response regulator CheB
MPEEFTAGFAQRLYDICQVEVREANDNDRVLDAAERVLLLHAIHQDILRYTPY